MYGHKLYFILFLPVNTWDKYNLFHVTSNGYCSLLTTLRLCTECVPTWSQQSTPNII